MSWARDSQVGVPVVTVDPRTFTTGPAAGSVVALKDAESNEASISPRRSIDSWAEKIAWRLARSRSADVRVEEPWNCTASGLTEVVRRTTTDVPPPGSEAGCTSCADTNVNGTETPSTVTVMSASSRYSN